MHGNDRAIISWAWKEEGKIVEGGQNQEGKKKKKTYELLSEGVVKCHDTGPLISSLWKDLQGLLGAKC